MLLKVPASAQIFGFAVRASLSVASSAHHRRVRLIGSIRRECLDHVVVFGERHLRHVLSCYIDYYNAARTHLSLDKDTPVERAVQSIGHIQARPVLGGLHHQYARI